MGGIGIWQLLIVLLVVVIVFGGKRLRSLGSDLGASLKGFKKEMSEEEKKEAEKPAIDKKDDDEPTKH